MHQTIAHTIKYLESVVMTKGEMDAYRKGFEKAKAECLDIVDTWSRSCHPKHPKKPTLKGRCWQHHGLQAAKKSIRRDVRLFAVPVRP